MNGITMLRTKINEYNNALDNLWYDRTKFNELKNELWTELEQSSEKEIELITRSTKQKIQSLINKNNYI